MLGGRSAAEITEAPLLRFVTKFSFVGTMQYYGGGGVRVEGNN